MDKTAITGLHTDLVDVCDIGGNRDYIRGTTEFTLTRWITNPSIGYFEKSVASIELHRLPDDLQRDFRDFEERLVRFINKSPKA